MKSATKALAGSLYISSGVPFCCITPLFITTIVSDIVNASSWSCVTNIKVIPSSCWIFFSSNCISFLSFKSSAPRGSSNRSTSGSLTKALAMATLCCCPPLRDSILLFSNPDKETILSISFTFLSISSFESFFIFNPNAMFS